MENKIKNNKFYLFSSAPAKVIFSGEHAVVYDSGAISCAINLRTSIKAEIILDNNNNHEVNYYHLNFYSIKNNNQNINEKTPEIFSKINLNFIVNFVFADFYSSYKSIIIGKDFNKGFDDSIYFEELYRKLQEFDIHKFIDLIEKKDNIYKEKHSASYIEINKNNYHIICIFCLILCIQYDIENREDITAFRSRIMELFSNFKFNFYINSDIPYFGSGLGSSGSFNVVLTNTLTFLVFGIERFIQIFTLNDINFQNVLAQKNSNEDIYNFLISNEKFNYKFLTETILLISYLGEKIFHLKPSGIDNLTSFNGGIINFKNFQKKIYEKKNNKIIKKLKENFKFFLIDTKIKRNTSTFIKQVSNFKTDFGIIFENSINSIAELVKQLNKLLDNEDTDNNGLLYFDETKKNVFSKIFHINQNLLSIIQVSSKEIDYIVQSMKEIDVAAKITGAGGGGFVLAAVEYENLDKYFEICRKKELSFIECDLTEEGLKTEIIYEKSSYFQKF